VRTTLTIDGAALAVQVEAAPAGRGVQAIAHVVKPRTRETVELVGCGDSAAMALANLEDLVRRHDAGLPPYQRPAVERASARRLLA
jgi:hypothetical protein